MDAIVPLSALCAAIEPHYPKAGDERSPIGLERMLRIHLLQHWFNVADNAVNADKARDAEIHQTKKANQWYFGMKLQIGVDSQSGLAQRAVVTAANVHDKHPLPDLLHGHERRVYGGSAFASRKALIHGKSPSAQDCTNQRTRREQRSRRDQAGEEPQQVEAPHPRRTCIRLGQAAWGFSKVRYRGLDDNATRAFVALALANF